MIQVRMGGTCGPGRDPLILAPNMLKHSRRGLYLASWGGCNPMPDTVHIHEDDLELYSTGHLEPERVPALEAHCLVARTAYSSASCRD